MATRRNRPLLGPVAVALVAGAVEAVVVWGVLGVPGRLADVLIITFAAMVVSQSGSNVRYLGSQPERLQALTAAILGFIATLILFAFLVAAGVRRGAQATYRAPRWDEYLLLASCTIPSLGIRAYSRRALR